MLLGCYWQPSYLKKEHKIIRNTRKCKFDFDSDPLNKELSNFSAIGAQRVDNLDAAQNTCQILIVELTLELH